MHRVSEYLAKVGIGEIDALVDGDLESLIVDHGPVTFVTIGIHSNIRSHQMQFNFLGNSKF